MLIEKFLKQAKESDGILPVCDHGSGDKVQCFE